MGTAKHDGPLEIQPNFLAEQADIDALLDGIEIALDVAPRPSLRALIERRAVPLPGVSPSRREMLTFLRSACTTYFHPVGTCAMGAGPAAVVDAGLRVHGVEDLRIADASIMPTITSANTNAPCVMIGEFAARQIVSGRAAADAYGAGAVRCHRGGGGSGATGTQGRRAAFVYFVASCA
jgi:choline dehydrogenase